MSYNSKLQYIKCSRREYIKDSLRRYNLPKEPLILFENWLKQVCEAGLIDPTAMIVATVDRYGQPWQRTVLLKYYDKNGFVFYTNLNSCKSYHIKFNSCVSLLFPWYILERQVIVTGTTIRISKLDATKYFQSRPYDSQISTLVSRQSSYISGRNILENNFLKLQQKFQNSKIQAPNFWGGYCISIQQIEFWQGGKYRLHDRFVYQRQGKTWNICRLAP